MTLVYLALAWLVGIWLARQAWSAGLMSCEQPSPVGWATLIALPIAVLLVDRWAGQRLPAWAARRQASHWLRLATVWLLLLVLGALRYQLHPFAPCFSDDDLAFYNGTLENPAWATITGALERPPEERDTRLRIRLRAQDLALGQAGEHQAVRGAALFAVERYPPLSYGDRISVRGRLESPPVFEGFDYREYLARHGVHSMIQRPEVTLLGQGEGSPFWQTLYALRERGQQVIARLVPEPEAALLTGILLGVETGIAPDLYERFNLTGVSHIIVISGFNIAIIAGVLAGIAGWLAGGRRGWRPVGRRWVLFPVVAGIALYTLLVGADGPVVRAAIMGGMVAWAAYLGRISTAYVSLFFAAFLMTLINPLDLWDVGFQMSFAATLGIVLLVPPLLRHLDRSVQRVMPKGASRTATRLLGDLLVVTLAAQVMVLPLIAHYFGRVSVVSPLANLLVLPVQPVIMIAGGAAVLVGLAADVVGLLEPLAQAVAWIPWLGLHWTVAVVDALARWPSAAMKVQLSAAGLAGMYALLAVGLVAPRLPALLAGQSSFRPLGALGRLLQRAGRSLASSKALAAATGSFLVVAVLLLLTVRAQPDGRMHVHFLDVGRGEAILIETPDGQQVLVDGGYSPTELLSALGRHMPFYDRQLELVVLTHPGDERIGGLVGLTERYRIQQVLQAPFPYPSAAYETWLRGLQVEGVPVARAEAGTRVDLGYGIALDVLHPGLEPALTREGELDLGANSVILRLSWGKTSFLLTGDVPVEVQEQLAGSGLGLSASVVKLPDGGRNQAFSQALLEATQPQHAVVFAQRDDRFRDLSAAVEEAWIAVVGPDNFHRTDLAGTVSFSSDGGTPQLADQHR